MAKWDELGFVTKEEHEALKAKYEELQKNVNCDYYEDYLREKLRREKLEAMLTTQLTGMEYYDLP